MLGIGIDPDLLAEFRAPEIARGVREKLASGQIVTVLRLPSCRIIGLQRLPAFEACDIGKLVPRPHRSRLPAPHRFSF